MDSENFKIIGVAKDIVSIEIIDSSDFEGQFNIGSYLKIPYKEDGDDCVIGIIKNYKIKNLDGDSSTVESSGNRFIIEVELIGSYKNIEGKYFFERGSRGIPLPPNNGIKIVSDEEYKTIYECKIKESENFIFSTLIQNKNIEIPVNGNKFFNKHFAIVGSTGSGKSHTVASVLQQAVKAKKDGGFEGLNNSRIVLFDIHGEYKKAFPEGNHIDSSNIKIPYWLFDSDELGDLFIESKEQNSHNQVSQFRYAVTENKKIHNSGLPQDKIYFDSPIKFNIDEVLQYIKNINSEVNCKLTGKPLLEDATVIEFENKDSKYFTENIIFGKTGNGKPGEKGPFKGEFERFILRLNTVRKNSRLSFLFDDIEDITLESVLKQFLGFKDGSNSNITVIDLGGIPFEILSITVSLISRLLFDYGYYYKKMLGDGSDCEIPLLLVYEEAHKYTPKSDLVKYRASKQAIEIIAKEGRKYGVTLGIISQRPSEISETIFSQCNNFVVMRLTNPDDQNYVKRLLPDTLGDITGYLSSLESGEAIIIGESIILPSLVKINFPSPEPHSTDIKYLELWKEKWKDDINFGSITDEFNK